MFDITHVKWSKHAIGIALRRLDPGDNLYRITAAKKDGSYMYPGTFVINREKAVEKYGVSIINHSDLPGVWVPLSELEKAGTDDSR